MDSKWEKAWDDMIADARDLIWPLRIIIAVTLLPVVLMLMLPRKVRIALTPLVLVVALPYFILGGILTMKPMGLTVLCGDQRVYVAWQELRTWPTGLEAFEARLEQFRAEQIAARATTR